MINFFVTSEGRFGISNYLAKRGLPIADRFSVRTYDEMADLREVPLGGAIFAALDQLTPTALDAAAAVCRQLLAADPGVTIYNTPERVLHRYELLTRLFASGHNRFTAIRATADPAGLRYPVFVRYERRHNGSLTRLLPDRAALDTALGELTFRGRRLADLIIVEFCDTIGSDGLYRKYSAMRIGGSIMARHLHAAASWVSKSQNAAVNEALVHEELEYVTNNPHAAWLEEVFTVAGIEFGRIDYGVYQGRPQVWEINTNPTFARSSMASGEVRRDVYRGIREASRVTINQRMIDAFLELELRGRARSVPITIDPRVRARLRMETRARSRAAAVTRLTRAVVDSAMTRALKSVVRPAVAMVAPAIGRLARHR